MAQASTPPAGNNTGPSFKGTIKTALLAKLVDAACTLHEFPILHVAPSGMTIHTMDSAHVCILSVHLPASIFDEFSCETEMDLDVRVKALRDVLLHVMAPPVPADQVEITCQGHVSTIRAVVSPGVERRFSLSRPSSLSCDVKWGKVERQVMEDAEGVLKKGGPGMTLTIKPSLLVQVLNDLKWAAEYSDDNVFEVQGPHLPLFSLPPVSILLSAGPCVPSLGVHEGCPEVTKFSIEYVGLNKDALLLATDFVTVEVTKAGPMIITVPLGKDDARLVVIYAPRVGEDIDDDDDDFILESEDEDDEDEDDEDD